MKKTCGITTGIAFATVAWLAYVLLMSLDKRQDGEEEGSYKLGSGRMFDEIAPRYDMINKVISLGLDMQWRRAMIEGLELRAGDRVLDLATGTADVAILIARELATLEGFGDPGTAAHETGSRAVVGIDPSAKMLDVGRKKATDAGLSSRVQLQIGDAQDLVEIPDGSVDKLTMAFGIRNVPHRTQALREIRRVMVAAESLQPSKEENEEELEMPRPRLGGTAIVAILELQRPESGPLAFLSSAFMRYAAPLLGAVISGSGAEYGHLKDSILNFPTVSEWIEIMAEAGLDVVAHQTMGFGVVHLYLARPSVKLDNSQISQKY